MAMVKKNIRISPLHCLLSLKVTGEHKAPEPGQFYMLRCSPCSDPLLRRPFSVYGYYPEKGEREAQLDFLFQIVGTGTRLISQMKENDDLDLIGPLGNGFFMPEGLENCLLIAGGIGVAPLPYLLERLTKKPDPPFINLIIGARTATQIVGLEGFKTSQCRINLYTEDGSLGIKGYATDGLDKGLRGCQGKISMVFACGPMQMLAKVAQACLSEGIPCQVSLDQRMACGVGACLGCVVKARSSLKESGITGIIYNRVCKEGPVFYAQDIEW